MQKDAFPAQVLILGELWKIGCYFVDYFDTNSQQ